MELLNSAIAFIGKLFQWWFVVMPWEQALLVRRGKGVRVLGAGIYFKIPFLDSLYIQTTRMRIIDTPMQTASTKDGSTVTVKAAIGYSIIDIGTLYGSLYHPEGTLSSMAMGFVGEFTRTKNLNELNPADVEQYVRGHIDSSRYGLGDFSIKITTFAAVKTYRLIQDRSDFYPDLSMEPKK